MIDPSRVYEMGRDCMYSNEEVAAMPEGIMAPLGSIRVDGITAILFFHPDRLESHREEVKGMLEQLPDEFMHGKGGGWSFLNMCNDKTGEQWTSYHKVVELLCVLAFGLKMGEWLEKDRNIWKAMPGGMPYVVFYPNGKEEAK